MNIVNLIEKKKNGMSLLKEEIEYFINGYLSGEMLDIQASSLVTLMGLKGLNADELIALTLAMANSGDKMNLSDIGNNIVDKHSTGCVGEKSTFILVPIMSALNVQTAKISSNGMSGGTITKLKSIPKFNADITIEKFKENIKLIGLGIMNQASNIAPAEEKMYYLRNMIGLTDNIPLIAASLISIKLATGNDKIVYHIACGNSSYIKNKEMGIKLAKMVSLLGKRLNKEVISVLINTKEPQGYSIGNILEIKEVVQALKNGEMAPDLEETVLTLGGEMLKLAGKGNNLMHNEKIIKEMLKTGNAYKRFVEMVEQQEGDISYLEDLEKLKKAKHIMPILSVENGYVKSIDADMIGSLVRYLNTNDEGKIEYEVGIELKKKIGDKVEVGEPLAYLHINDEDKIKKSSNIIIEAYEISQKPVDRKTIILDII